MDYSFYYRKELKLEEDWGEWDLFLSAFNLSDRLKKVYQDVSAKQKFWLIFPEYNFNEGEINADEPHISVEGKSESEQLSSIINSLDLTLYKNKNICIDITGFMRPQLLELLLYFNVLGFEKIDFIYSEPSTYAKREKTQFTFGAVSETRSILGYSGTTKATDGKDLLIIASGYDSTLISKVAQQKENSEIVHVIGFPSLRPDMYQENILRTLAVEDSFIGNNRESHIFAPASDPFETANIIKDYILNNDCLNRFKHIYISPLSTKAQTLGIGLV